MVSFKQFLAEKVTPTDVKLSINYHSKLNPDLWAAGSLKVRVRDALLEIGQEFFHFLEMPYLKIVDVIITGSMANYNWTASSDIDVHFIVDLDTKKMKAIDFRDIFDTKKSLWEQKHKITIYGHPVEMYVQLKTDTLTAAGIYSLVLNQWIERPVYTDKGKNIDQYSVKIKTASIMNSIDAMIKHDKGVSVGNTIKSRIKNMRKSGLEQGGEFSIENITFKALRNNGYIAKLFDYIRKKRDEDLSLFK